MIYPQVRGRLPLRNVIMNVIGMIEPNLAVPHYCLLPIFMALYTDCTLLFLFGMNILLLFHYE